MVPRENGQLNSLNHALGKVEGRLEGLAKSVDSLKETIEIDRRTMVETVEALSTAQRTLLENYNSLQTMVGRMQPHVEAFAEQQAQGRGKKQIGKTLHAIWISIASVAGGVVGAFVQAHLGNR